MLAALRLIGLGVVLALAVCMLAWLLTGDPRWRRRAWLVFRFSAFGAAFLLLLFAGEALWRLA